MVNTTKLRELFAGNTPTYLSEIGLSECGYYKILRTEQASLRTLTRICGYFNIPISELVIIPEDYYQ